MTIGLSLPLGYLTGADDSANSKCFADAFGDPRDCLAELGENGVTSIELQGFGPDTPPARLRDGVVRILESGRQLTLHGYLSDSSSGCSSSALCSQLISVADLLQDQQDKTTVVLHALSSPEASYSDMVTATSRALERFVEDIRTHDLPVRIALEINRYHGVESPGTTYDGLLEIARDLGDAEVGFCWDMGHTASSILQKRSPPAPPAEFIGSVVHTHIHAVSPEGDTHWPLTEDSPYLASAISRLAARGYTGRYNLELYPIRWGAQHDVKDGILRSILCLRALTVGQGTEGKVDHAP